MEVEKTSVVDSCPKQRCFESPFFFGAGEVLNGTSLVREQKCFI